MIVMSGDDEGPLESFLTGELWFITINENLSRALIFSPPQFAALSSRVEQYHEVSCALKSPIIRMSPGQLRRELKSGAQPIGRKEAGVM